MAQRTQRQFCLKHLCLLQDTGSPTAIVISNMTIVWHNVASSCKVVPPRIRPSLHACLRLLMSDIAITWLLLQS